MANVQFEWIDDGFHEILNCDELRDVCLQAAKDIASRAGENFEAERWYSNMKGGRVAAIVTANDAGDFEEATEKKLSRAVSTCAS